MYCPNCGSEYREGFKICSDCQVALVPGEPPETLMPADPGFSVDEYDRAEPVCVLVEAATVDAEITVSALRNYGIRAYAAGTGMEAWSEAGGIGQITRVPGPLNEIRIMVHPDDLSRARQIINLANLEVEPEPPRISGEDAVWRVDRAKRKRVLRAIALFLLVPLVLTLAYEAVFALDLFAGLFD
jgi:Putative prokaryotic signal transducing protein